MKLGLERPIDNLNALERPIDRSFTLFQGEDTLAWIIFLAVFLGLLTYDSAIMFAKPRKMNFTSAVAYTLFWGSTAFLFCLWVGWWQEAHSAYMWLSGYTLQWMMSFDNLFVFHLVFKVYQVPDQLKHRPLFLGLLGQAIITFSLLTVGEYLFHTFYWLHLFFGAFFIYMGVSSVIWEDEDEDPTQNPLIQWMQTKLPFVHIYDTEGHFFVRVPIDNEGNVFIPECAQVHRDTRLETDPILQHDKSDPSLRDLLEESKKESKKECGVAHNAIIDLSRLDIKPGQKTELRATMLFLVVITLEISDVIFSVDTIVAVSVQVGDLFLAFTCVAFALLTLRATFFILEVLVQMFELLKYGISFILCYIGVKLIIDRWVLVPQMLDCFVLVGTFGLSILASGISDKFKDDSERAGAEDLLSNSTTRTTPGTTPASTPASTGRQLLNEGPLTLPGSGPTASPEFRFEGQFGASPALGARELV